MSPNTGLRQLSRMDRAIAAADVALRTLTGALHASRPYPARAATTGLSVAAVDAPLPEFDAHESGALMRVNHVGEVCAQALYSAQSLGTTDVALRRQLDAAAREEADHLAWTRQRLDELGDRPSLLNPLWYAGSFAIGWLASRAGTATSLGFVVETERQVERHLAGHLERLSVHDTTSRAIVTQMQADEAAHAASALRSGAAELSWPTRWAMRAVAKVMTVVAHRI